MMPSYTTDMATKHWFDASGGPRAHRSYEAESDVRYAQEKPPGCCDRLVPPAAGAHQDGERWTCPECGRVWGHVTEEAEGCWWEPVVPDLDTDDAPIT